jgi:hypothetical protein
MKKMNANPEKGHDTKHYKSQFPQGTKKAQGLGSVDGIATAYRLDGPGIESRWGRDFPHLSGLALRPTQPPVEWVPGCDADLSLLSSAEVKNRVELYLYSP